MWRGALIALIACRGSSQLERDAGVDASPGHAVITATVGSTRFVTREHMLAAGEMQISGEPLAEQMGRDLTAYSRDRLPTDLYHDVTLNTSWIDLPGFSSGVESYEYSKQPMNELEFEAGAGTSLVYGPLVDFDAATGTAARAHLVTLVQHFAQGAHTLGRFVFAAGTYPSGNASGNTNPTGAGDPANNVLGWPGMWPTNHVFASFDPAIDPTGEIALGCAITSDDDPDGMIGSTLVSGDYECDATTLHLPHRATQIDATITPGADGFSAWKYGLWVLNYLQVMHDVNEAPVATVATADLGNVGTVGNQIIGADGNGNATAAGTFLGSSDIEGFQAQMFITSLDNRAADWIGQLSTVDGATLTGFASLQAALSYDYVVPLRWFPGQIAVTESSDGSGFPSPAYTLASADSELLDLAGLVLGYSELYALTDTRNADVGGSQPALAYFDGDPFPADDQLADGESTPHDRALAMLRVAVVDLDRLHGDPATGILVDHVGLTGSVATPGTTVATTSLAYTLLALRTARRSLGSQLELYSNNTPDTALATTPLDALAIRYPGQPALAFGDRLDQILLAQATLLYDHLTDATGRAWTGWNLATGAPIDDDDALDSHTAAIRGLFAAYLATGDVRYHDRAIAVFDRMQTVFYDAGARIYSATPAPVDSVEYTPMRFALLQSALRDIYELVATRPGGELLVPLVEARLARLNKLVLNGWDDRDADAIVQWPEECVNVDATGLPHGGLEMAERTLTGEIGTLQAPLLPGETRTPTSDREHDCVPEIDDAHLPAALADSVTFAIARQP